MTRKATVGAVRAGRFAAALLAGLVVVFAFPTPALAQTSASESHVVTGTLSSGGGEASSASFRVISSLDATGVAGGSASASSSLVSGGGVWLVSLQFDDDDGDSIANGEEGSVSGGDGNGDAIPDQFQATVASLSGVGTPLTAEIESGGCRAITLAQALTTDDLSPSARYRFPHGLVRVSLACDAPGAEAVVRLLFHAPAGTPWPLADFRAYGVRAPDFEGQVSYYSLPTEETGVADVGGQSVPFVVVRLRDGLYGDANAEGGIVELTAGPAAESRPARR